MTDYTHKLHIYIKHSNQEEIAGDYASILATARLLLQTDTCNGVRVVGMFNSDNDATYEYEEEVPLC